MNAIVKKMERKKKGRRKKSEPCKIQKQKDKLGIFKKITGFNFVTRIVNIFEFFYIYINYPYLKETIQMFEDLKILAI